MSEETTMHEELTSWKRTIDDLLALAREMQTPDQDADFVTREIYRLFNKFEALEPDEDGIAARYHVDLEHPQNRKYRIVFECFVSFDYGED